MNNKLVINFVPGPTPVHKLAGSTKVLMFLLFTAAIIATFDELFHTVSIIFLQDGL